MLLLNSNGIDVVLSEAAASFRTIGGVLDLYFFAGPRPEDVLEQYTAIVGRPRMPPFWSLGFHNCKSALLQPSKRHFRQFWICHTITLPSLVVHALASDIANALRPEGGTSASL